MIACELKIRCIGHAAQDLDQNEFLELLWKLQSIDVISEEEYFILIETLIPW